MSLKACSSVKTNINQKKLFFELTSFKKHLKNEGMSLFVIEAIAYTSMYIKINQDSQ